MFNMCALVLPRHSTGGPYAKMRTPPFAQHVSFALRSSQAWLQDHVTDALSALRSLEREQEKLELEREKTDEEIRAAWQAMERKERTKADIAEYDQKLQECWKAHLEEAEKEFAKERDHCLSSNKKTAEGKACALVMEKAKDLKPNDVSTDCKVFRKAKQRCLGVRSLLPTLVFSAMGLGCPWKSLLAP